MRKLTVIGIMFLMVLVTAFGGTADKAAAETYTYSSSFSEPVTIPDNDDNGTELTINVSCSFIIDNMSVTLDIEHSWVGDLGVLVEAPTGDFLWLTDQDWWNANKLAQGEEYMFTDSASDHLPVKEWPHGYIISGGSYLPDDGRGVTFALSFKGLNAIGDWKLWLCDDWVDCEGALYSWKLDFEGVPASPIPGDFGPDGDVDGSDLAEFAGGGTGISLQEFAKNLGKTGYL
ncbi:MAG: hypothetical protein U9N60_01675 [Thermodesulfobacteriota bacterium]|nr:hypothetical protein [Thermodesulfobacteriota bacterium]